ncbi:hypothetical protein AAVH_40497, partial [Aphelenchoides avenae]
MKRQGSHKTTLEAYFGKRARVAAAEDDQPDDVVVVSTGTTALQMIAEAYASDDEEQAEEQEQTVCYADPTDVAHDHNYCSSYGRQEHVDHDHSYTTPSEITTQTGGTFGFDSSEDEPEAVSDDEPEAHDSDSGEEELQEIVPDEELQLEDLYEVVDHRIKRVKKFGLNGYATKFVLKDDERVDQPVEMLRHVLQRFIDDALENSREHGYSTDWMGLSFITESMKKGNGGKGEWLVPFNPPNENNADKILQETEKFDQSENSPELFGIRKKQIRRPEKKDPAIVEINNRDNLCLFRAICVHMFYHETGEGMWKQAQRYSNKGELDHNAKFL